MNEFFSSHMAEAWFMLGFILLAIELFAFGMTSGVLLFAGIGGIVTGGFLWSGLLPESWGAAILCFALTTGVSVAVLWSPFKRLQSDSNVDHTPTSDLIGLRFWDISKTNPGSTRYSGIAWSVEIAPDSLAPSIASGITVEVVSVDAGIFRVRPANTDSEPD